MLKLTKANLRLMIIEAIDEISCEMEAQQVENDEIDEFSGAGGGQIAGYSLPLGMRPSGPRKQNKK
jgi:hypothetical protein